MNITLENAVDLFLVDQDIKGNSKKTIEYYKNTFGKHILICDICGEYEEGEGK